MKIRKMIVLGTCMAMITASICGCGGKTQAPASSKESSPASETAESIQESIQESSTQDVAEKMNELGILLPFMYAGDEPYLNDICIWSEREFGPYFEGEGVLIPEPVIYYVDDSDEQDIKIWGDFWIEKYTLQDETLISQSGGENPGLLHLKKADEDRYEVTDFERVGDGSDFGPDLERIFSKAPAEAGDLVKAFSSSADDGTREKARKTFLRMYADAVPQKISYYQDYGWDPVPLYEEDTADESAEETVPESDK